MKEEWIGQGILFLVGMILCTIVASAWSATQNPFPQALLMPLLMIAGTLCILIARIPLYKQGTFLAFGPQKLPRASRKWYWTGYSLFGVGVIWTLLFITFTRMIQQRVPPNTHSPSAQGVGGR